MRRSRIPLLLLAILAALAPRLHAQWRLSGDAGLSHLNQLGLQQGTASTIGATLDNAGDWFALRTSALGAKTWDGRSTGQWIGTALGVTPSWRGLALQLTGSLSAFNRTNDSLTSSGDAALQLRMDRGLRGAALGGGVGSTRRGNVARGVDRVLGDAWWSVADERLSGEIAVTRTPGESYADLATGWNHDAGGLTLSAVGGVRYAQHADASAWTTAEAALWIAPRVALVVGGGRTLEDLVRGVPRTTFATAAVRIVSRPRITLFQRARNDAEPRITVVRLENGRQRIDVRASGATSVALMADFTAWAPVLLEHVGDAWRLEQGIAAGPHRVAIRIGDGPWIVPSNLPHIEDDLGGSVGLISVP